MAAACGQQHAHARALLQALLRTHRGQHADAPEDCLDYCTSVAMQSNASCSDDVDALAEALLDQLQLCLQHTAVADVVRQCQAPPVQQQQAPTKGNENGTACREQQAATLSEECIGQPASRLQIDAAVFVPGLGGNHAPVPTFHLPVEAREGKEEGEGPDGSCVGWEQEEGGEDGSEWWVQDDTTASGWGNDSEAEEQAWWEEGSAHGGGVLSCATSSDRPMGAIAGSGERLWCVSGGLAAAAAQLDGQAAAELLALLFPVYSTEALQALLAARGGELAACVKELEVIEREAVPGGRRADLQGGMPGALPRHLVATPGPTAVCGLPQPLPMYTRSQRAARAGGSGTGAQQTPAQPLALSSADEFPSLRPAAGEHQVGMVTAAGAGWAAIAQHSAAVSRTQYAPKSLQPALGSEVNPGQQLRGQQGRGGRGLRKSAHSLPEGVPWVETGTAVAAMYSYERTVARDWARLRNACFQQATLAYLAGDKALARQLSRQGRDAADKMHRAHATAAARILSQRHQGLAGGGRQRASAAPPMLDLHGLHVAEALSVLEVQLGEMLQGSHSSDARQQRVPQLLRVCMGTGSHTRGPKTAARLPAAVTAALSDWGLRYREVTPGLLEVTVAKSDPPFNVVP